ncbi:MAG: hypothetical protein R3E79_42680 [Caldilineaceae bacterium]
MDATLAVAPRCGQRGQAQGYAPPTIPCFIAESHRRPQAMA